jgi:hypothetical protein
VKNAPACIEVNREPASDAQDQTRMNSGDKIPKRLALESIDEPCPRGKVWRMVEIIAESTKAAEGRAGLRPAASTFDHDRCSFEPSAQQRGAQRDL